MLQVKRQGGSERFLFRARSDIVKSLSSKISGSNRLRKSGVFKNFNSMIVFSKIEISVTGVF